MTKKTFVSVGQKVQFDPFNNCVAWGKNGDFCQKYLHKGMKIALEGRIQTGSYTKDDGTKVYTTDVIVEHQTRNA